MARLLALLVPLLLLGACASSPEEGAGGAAVEELAGRWILLEVPAAPELLPEGAAWRPTLEVRDDGAVAGHAGVNRYSGQLDAQALAQGGFDLGPVVMTRMAGRPEAMRLEQRFVQELERAQRWRLVDGGLELLADGDVLLRFTPAG